jgi:LuxR family transcriptional regulator
MNWQNEDICAVLDCKTTTEVFQFLQNEMRRLGMQSVSWVMKMPLPLLDPKIVIFNTYSKAWEKQYFANNYLAIDPTIKHGMNSSLPILWSDKRISQEAPEFWEEARSFGLGVGFAQSVFDRQHMCSMLTLCRDSLDFSGVELADKAPRFSWLAQLTHAGMTRLIVPKEMPETTANLTVREKEVLKLVASGMTSQDIADRLHVAKRTADFHIEEATKKLGAENRTDAAVKTIILGLA